jgi:hypothetical protein
VFSAPILDRLNQDAETCAMPLVFGDVNGVLSRKALVIVLDFSKDFLERFEFFIR